MNALTQMYSVNSLVLSGRRVSFDEELACQFFVLDKNRCQFVVTTPAMVLDGPKTLRQVVGKGHARLDRIEYTIIGTADGQRIHTQPYFHDFSADVDVDDSFVAECRVKALFIPYQLDVVLDTKNRFPKVTAVQFIA